MTEITELPKWERASNYLGEDLSDYFIVYSKHRDSDYAAQSNFECILESLGGESEFDKNKKQKVIVAHFGHWAVGWVESILIYKDAIDEYNKALELLNRIEQDDILNWDKYEEVKHEKVQELVDDIKKDIENGNAKFWDCYGITETSTDDEIWEIADQQVY